MPIIPKFPIAGPSRKPPVVPPAKPVPTSAPTGSYYNNQGRLVNKQGQFINDKGQAVNKSGYLINSNNQRINEQGQLVNKGGQAVDAKNRLINESGHLINSQGKLVNEKGSLVDTQGRLVNNNGRLVNTDGHLIDKDGKRVNNEGVLIDRTGRPLDKNGKVARDQASAAKGNNEPHEQLLAPGLKQKALEWRGKVTPPPAPPKLTVADAVTRMVDADKMVKKGVINTSPSAAKVARDAAISAGVTGVVSAPINIASYAGSTAAAEQIKATYVPLPMVPPTPIAKSSVERPEPASTASATPAAVIDESVYKKLNEDQALTFSVANQSMALRFGDTANGFIPSQSWSTDPLERMSQMETLVDFAEEHTKVLSETYQVYFKPTTLPAEKAPEDVAGLATRLDRLEVRVANVDKVHKTVISNSAQATV